MLWVEVLNRGLEPAGPGTLQPPASGRSANALLEQGLDLLRAAAAARILGTALPEPRLSEARQWLATVTLEPAACERRNAFDLPAVRARRPASRLPEDTETLLSTALVELLTLGEAVKAVSRCHGLVRPGAEPGPWGAEFDAAAARLAGLSDFVRAGWRQCPRLVLAPRQARYCSKACSNATFAARKGSRDPRYFAAKQALYRDRLQRRAAARLEPRSVLFVD